MRKLFIPLIILLSLTFSAHATGDSLQYLTPKDTIFIQVDDFGNKIFTHFMEKGQTLYSLARFYGLKTDVLLAFNPDLQEAFSVGQPVHIPIPDTAIVKKKDDGYPMAGYVPVRYVVKHGDNFYRIARHYFNIPLDTLQQWNRLEKTMMFSGMQLHIGYLSLSGIPDSLQFASQHPLSAQMLRLQLEFMHKQTFLDPTFQNGAAYWQREKEGKTDYYALHRYAPIGSVIQISNPMKKKTVFAKVLARIPDRAYGDDIIVVLSPTVAKLLGARDPKFYVEILYY